MTDRLRVEARSAHFQAVRLAAEDRSAALLEFLGEIVTLESPSEEKALADRLAEVLARRAESIGMEVEFERDEQYGDTVVARLVPSGGEVRSRVLLVGHYDTVYPSGTIDQRPFVVDGDLATGPGVFDMKGGVAIGLFALEILRTIAAPRDLAVTFVMNGDEEPGSPNSRRVIEKEAPGHDVALILEPGRPGPGLTVARKGVGIFRLRVSGIEAHAGADPTKGANSIVELATKTIAVYELNDPERGTSVTPGVVFGGTHPYVVPGHAELAFDVRVETEAEQGRMEEAFRQIAQSIHVGGTRTELLGGFHRPPLVPSPESGRYVALIQSVADAVGYPLGTGTSGGASDGNLTAALGVPTVDGLGAHGGGAHSRGEYIEVSSLVGKAAVLAGSLLALDSGAA